MLKADETAPVPIENAPVLKAEAVTVLRGRRPVFKDLSLSIAPGEAIVLAGPNGSGKSTLLRLLAGLVRPVAGCVLWQDQDVLDDLAAHAGRIAYVGHLDGVKPGLTVTENLHFFATIARRPIGPALAAMALQPLADLPSRMLSAGQKRRLALSRLMLSSAPLWLLDEPTLGLDAASIGRFGHMLATHRQTGGMVIAATHIPLPLPHVTEFRLG